MRSLILLVVLLVTICGSLNAANKTDITLEDILAGRFNPERFSGAWKNDTIQYTLQGNIRHFSMTGDDYLVVNRTEISEMLGSPASSLDLESFWTRFVLVGYARKNVWRYSFEAKYAIFDTVTKELEPIMVDETGESLFLQLIRWAPTGIGFAFVYQNNLYYSPNDPFKQIIQITMDGDVNKGIFNGHTDWVYEEEMFGTNQAFWFSPNSESLAFVRFDNSKVEHYRFTKYGEPEAPFDHQYTEIIDIPYPKAGTANPTYSLHYVDLKNPLFVNTFQFDSEAPENHYIAHAAWADDQRLLFISMNRSQNDSRWYICGTSDGWCQQIFRYTEPQGWVSIYSPKFTHDGHLLTLMYKNIDGEHYRHIVKINTFTGQETQISSGKISVSSIIGLDKQNADLIFFQATGMDEVGNNLPSQQHVYFVDSQGEQVCFTCGRNNSFDEPCDYNSMSLNSDLTHYTYSCNGPGIPQTVTENIADGSIVQTWTTNEALKLDLETKNIPLQQNFEVDLPDGFKANVRLFLPADFDAGSKYPLFIDVYAGPNSVQISDSFSLNNWGMSLVSSKKVIYGYIDGRGSGRQTSELLFQLHLQLGVNEVQDQIDVARWLIENTGFIDENKTAIWGWSYGGYATSRAMIMDNENVFKCGIAVAPVTSWYLYDTIYTERYMDTPQNNEVMYTETDVFSDSAKLENFRNKSFMLVHGNADDNVHYQQSMLLARALEKNDIFFYQLNYPDENHGINGPGMRRHLYHSLERFLFDDCFTNEEQNSDKSNDNSPAAATKTDQNHGETNRHEISTSQYIEPNAPKENLALEPETSMPESKSPDSKVASTNDKVVSSINKSMTTITKGIPVNVPQKYSKGTEASEVHVVSEMQSMVNKLESNSATVLKNSSMDSVVDSSHVPLKNAILAAESVGVDDSVNPIVTNTLSSGEIDKVEVASMNLESTEDTDYKNSETDEIKTLDANEPDDAIKPDNRLEISEHSISDLIVQESESNPQHKSSGQPKVKYVPSMHARFGAIDLKDSDYHADNDVLELKPDALSTKYGDARNNAVSSQALSKRLVITVVLNIFLLKSVQLIF